MTRATPLHPPGAPEVDASRQPERRDRALSNSVATPGQAAVPDEAVGACSRSCRPDQQTRPTPLRRRSAQSDSQRPRRRAAEFAQKEASGGRAPDDRFHAQTPRTARSEWRRRRRPDPAPRRRTRTTAIAQTQRRGSRRTAPAARRSHSSRAIVSMGPAPAIPTATRQSPARRPADERFAMNALVGGPAGRTIAMHDSRRTQADRQPYAADAPDPGSGTSRL